jgi:serine-type D-Ala-D-Ala carboxypeptidase (penicillin-binding protein 5/6)
MARKGCFASKADFLYTKYYADNTIRMTRQKLIPILSVASLVLLSTAAFFTIEYTGNPEHPFKIESPLPSLLSQEFPKALGTSHWQPHTQLIASSIKKPEITATSAISYDVTSEQLLYERDMKKRVPIASLTKIMTAIIALENEPLDKEYSVSEAAIVGENTMGLTVGEKLTLEELLHGLILHSGNDAAETIAMGSKFGRENFLYLMNKKAQELGLSDTNFTNPSGLEGDGNQYSTVYDLLVFTRYALENPDFKRIVAAVEYEIPENENHKYFYLQNQTNLLTTYPGVKGVKTGFTDEAGMCLVTYLDFRGHHIIAILLNSENRRQEMKDLLDYSLKTLGIEPPLHS